jgi:hypothetical protein
VGGGVSKHHNLEELKYLVIRDDFHHFVVSVIKRQARFSPREVFIRIGSLIASCPLLRGWKTCFQLRRWNFLVFVFPPAQRKLQRALDIFSRSPFRARRPEH